MNSNLKQSSLEADQKDLRHDLKNKLTVIQGFSELLLTKLQDEKQKSWAQEILNNSKELLKMIDEKVR